MRGKLQGETGRKNILPIASKRRMLISGLKGETDLDCLKIIFPRFNPVRYQIKVFGDRFPTMGDITPRKPRIAFPGLYVFSLS